MGSGPPPTRGEEVNSPIHPPSVYTYTLHPDSHTALRGAGEQSTISWEAKATLLQPVHNIMALIIIIIK